MGMRPPNTEASSIGLHQSEAAGAGGTSCQQGRDRTIKRGEVVCGGEERVAKEADALEGRRRRDGAIRQRHRALLYEAGSGLPTRLRVVRVGLISRAVGALATGSISADTPRRSGCSPVRDGRESRTSPRPAHPRTQRRRGSRCGSRSGRGDVWRKARGSLRRVRLPHRLPDHWRRAPGLGAMRGGHTRTRWLG